jgi:hypothetical protein
MARSGTVKIVLVEVSGSYLLSPRRARCGYPTLSQEKAKTAERSMPFVVEGTVLNGRCAADSCSPFRRFDCIGNHVTKFLPVNYDECDLL